MKYLIGLVAMLLPLLSGAQAPPVKALSIGDTVPDITIANVYNYRSSTIRLSDLKGKLVILDFWATWCEGCLRKLPSLDSLQNDFDDKIQVLLINSKNTNDDSGKIKRFIKAKKLGKNDFSLPVISNDTVFDVLFPHKMIPHYVWIGSDGKVKGITGSDEVTYKNITEILSGNKAALKEKKDFLEFNETTPLFVNGNGGNGENIIFRSMLTGYLPGLPTSIGGGNIDDSVSSRIYCTNVPVILLYKLAYPGLKNFPNSRIKIESPTPAKYIPEADNWDTWKVSNTYCYELMVPPFDKKRKSQIMREDLVRYFGLHTSIQNKKVDCWVITRLPAINKNVTISSNVLKDANTGFGYVHCRNISGLAEYLNTVLSTPVIDNSAYKGALSIDLPEGVITFSELKNLLNKEGFELKNENKEMEMFIISESQSHL